MGSQGLPPRVHGGQLPAEAVVRLWESARLRKNGGHEDPGRLELRPPANRQLPCAADTTDRPELVDIGRGEVAAGANLALRGADDKRAVDDRRVSDDAGGLRLPTQGTVHSGVNDDVEWGAVDLPSLRGDHDGARPARGLISARRRTRATRRRHDEGVGAPQVTIRLVIGPNDIRDGRSERDRAYGQPRGDRHERARVEVGWPEDPHGRGNEDGWIDRGRGCYGDGDSITLAAQREFAHGSEVR